MKPVFLFISTEMKHVKLVAGDLLAQDVDCIVNPWNMNFIPRWLLMPGGVSRQIRKKAGATPFREIAQQGLLRSGSAVLTEGGLINKPIIHVAGLNMWWRSSQDIVFRCTASALKLARKQSVASIALPAIGSGTGGLTLQQSLTAMMLAVRMSQYIGEIRIIVWPNKKKMARIVCNNSPLTKPHNADYLSKTALLER